MILRARPPAAGVTCRSETKAAAYAEALRSVGVEPVLLRPGGGSSVLGRLAGLVLTGGGDVNPALYGQPRHPLCEDPDDALDAFESTLLREALARDAPILAICRGMQLFNVVHSGGTLKQHVDGHESREGDAADAVHDVMQTPGTRLAAILGPGPLPVNSRHHQAVDEVGAGLTVSSRACGDGLIEGLERPDLRFAVAVQWHPEDQAARFPEQRRLFESFAASL